MKRSVVVALGLIAAMSVVAAAQSNSFQEQFALVGVVDGHGTEASRPLNAPADPPVLNRNFVEHSAFDMINQKRAENGLRPLTWSDQLELLARRHSQDMADNKYFGHQGMDGSRVSDRADREGVGGWRLIGENIAYNRGYKDPTEMAVNLWMESAPHRQNLLNGDWRESAVGVAVAADGSYYFTQVFILRK